MSESEPDFEEVARHQRRRGELETRRDVWLTAAVMTCLLAPGGTLFGILALVVARGSRAALAANDLDRADGKLALCRVLVAIGTTIGAMYLLYQLTTIAGGMAAIGMLLGNATGSPR